MHTSSFGHRLLRARPWKRLRFFFVFLVDIWVRLTETRNLREDEGDPYARYDDYAGELITRDTSRITLLVDVLHGDLGKVAILLLKNIRHSRKEKRKGSQFSPSLLL